MTDQSEQSLSSQEVQAALSTLLGYLFLQVRQRDGVPAPPLLDRNDFLAYLDELLLLPNLEPTLRPGLVWLMHVMRQHGAQLPDEFLRDSGQ